MIWIIDGMLGVFCAALTMGLGRVSYLRGHRAGFTAGRSEGYRDGVDRGHRAGLADAPERYMREVGETMNDLLSRDIT